jgi:hypothetical protein
VNAKIEKILFYPVTIILTVLALQAWMFQPMGLAAALTATAIGLWILPFLGVKFILARRILFWISAAFLLLGLAWIYALSRY